MAKILQQGFIELEGNLINQDLWKYLHRGLVQQIAGKAWFPRQDGKRGKTDLVISQVLPRGKVPVQIAPTSHHIDLLYPEQAQHNAVMMDAFMRLFQSLIDDGWLLLGKIAANNQPLVIVYFEQVSQAWYALLNHEESRVLASNLHYLN